jgi:hypothetical protein
MQSWPSMRPSRLVWICWTAALLALSTPPVTAASDLFKRFNALDGDEHAVEVFLKGLTQDETLSLCNEIGASVEGKSAAEVGESMPGFLIMLHYAKSTADISPELLLHIAQDKRKSAVWRGFVLRFSAGREDVVSPDRVEVENALPVYLKLAEDSSEPERVRREAMWAAAEVLKNAYTALAAKLDAQGPIHLPPGEHPLHHVAFATPEWRRLDRLNEGFLRVCIDLLGSTSAPPTFKVEGVVRALGATAWVRGAQTPGLSRTDEVMRKLLASDEVRGWDENLRRGLQSCADGIRELVGDGGEHHK